MSVSQSNNNMATTTFTYPGCAEESTGPCALQTSSEDACSRIYTGDDDFYAQELCMCTNGYYNRSSECWIDCYGYGATSTDYTSISLEVALASVKCESYSLDVLSQSLWYASLRNASASEASESASSAATSSSFAGGGANATAGGGSSVFSGTSASQGATATLTAPQSTTDWVQRPSSTQPAQTGGGVSTTRRPGGRRSALASATAVLVLLSVFCN